MKVLFGALMALILPLRWTSRLYLEQQLRENGIDPARISRACLQELADDVIDYAKVEANLLGGNVRAIVVQHMDVQAIQVASVLNPPPTEGPDWLNELQRYNPLQPGTDSKIGNILRKHRVIN